jgi:hypothetical protein
MLVRYSAKGAISEEPASMPQQPARQDAKSRRNTRPRPFDSSDARVLDAARDALDALEAGILSANVPPSSLTKDGHLSRERVGSVLPDLAAILNARVIGSLIGRARCTGNNHADRGPFITASFDDPAGLDEKREKYFDPWWFPALLLMEVSGAYLVLHRSKDEKRARPESSAPPFGYYYLMVRWRGDQGVMLNRIITNVPSRRSAVWKDRWLLKHHYRDYRSEVFTRPTRSEEQGKGLKVHSAATPYGGRKKLLDHLPVLFDARVKASEGSTAAIGDMTTQGYMELVHRALKVADRIDAKLRLACGEDENTPRDHLRQWVP